MKAELREIEKTKPEMIEVNLDLAYKVRDSDRASKQFEKNIDVSAFMIQFAFNVKYGEKMTRRDSRIWADIQDTLIDKPQSLKLSQADFDWVYKTVTDCEYGSGFSSWRRTLCDYLEELKIKTGKKEE